MRRLDPFLLVVLGIFLTLATTYSVVVPLFEGPDEDDHYRYAKYLADHRALPVQLFQAGGGEAGHQGWQPPLYYALAAVPISPVDTSDFHNHLQRNPAAALVGDITCCGRNQYMHLASEAFPYKGTTLAVHLARGVTILFGLITVLAIYNLVLTLYPAQRGLALVTTALATLNPSFLYSSALVSNDVPLAALCTLSLLLMIKIILSDRPPNLKWSVVLGVSIALGLLIKTTALGLVPFAVAVPAFLAWRTRQLRVLVVSLVGILLPIALLTGWWFIRNQVLYGDPLAYRLLYASAMFPRDAPPTWAELFQINLPWMWQTFWGGPTPGDFPQSLLAVLLIICSLALFGLVILMTRSKGAWFRSNDGQNRVVGLTILGSWLAFILLAQIQFVRTSGGTDQGRYLFPAIAPFALFLVLGVRELASTLASRLPIAPSHLTPVVSRSTLDISRLTFNVSRFSVLLSLLLLSLLPVYVLFAFTLPAYAAPGPFDPTHLGSRATPLTAEFSNHIALHGYSLSARHLTCADRLSVTLYWAATRSIGKSFRVFVHLVGEQGRVAGGKDVIPGRGAYPTVYWKPNEWLEDRVDVRLNPGARAGDYSVRVGMYPFGEPDNRVNLAGSDADTVSLGNIRIDAPPEGCP